MSGPFEAPSWWPCQTIAPPGLKLLRLDTEDIRVAFCFSVEQHDKIRRCEDLRRSGHNSTVVAFDTPHHHTVETFISLAASYAQSDIGSVLWSQDMNGAYRQFPVSNPNECFCCLVTPSGAILLRHHAVMFGATAAVWNFNRAADSLTFLCRRLLAISLMHYVDDFVGLEGRLTASSGFSEFTRLAAIIGMKMKEVKAQEPAASHKVLGVTFTIEDDQVVVSPHPDRLQRTRAALNLALQQDELHPDTAQRLAGKLVFLTSSMFGKLGRAALCPFYGRAHGLSAHGPTCSLNTPLRHAIRFLLVLFDEIKPRVIPLKVRAKPAVLYTDAYFVLGGVAWKPGDPDIPTKWSTRAAPSFENGLGFVFHNHGRPCFAQWTVPATVLKAFCGRRAFIYFLEILAQMVAILLVVKEDLRFLVSFIDNAPGRHALMKGYCSDPAICRLLAVHWRLLARTGLHVHLDWVASSLNISDKVSRGDFTEMALIHAQEVPLNLTPLWKVLSRVATSDDYAYGGAVDDLLSLHLSSVSLCSDCTGDAAVVPVRIGSGTCEAVAAHAFPDCGSKHFKASRENDPTAVSAKQNAMKRKHVEKHSMCVRT
eukprot:Skav210514  [mRNA]  locus=scaffold3045:20256:22040:+ [translate_table: standard]